MVESNVFMSKKRLHRACQSKLSGEEEVHPGKVKQLQLPLPPIGSG